MNPLNRALELIGANVQTRELLLAALRQIEQALDYSGPIRDDITGPIADAMFDANQQLTKALNDGTAFEFLYRSKIAREFVLSNPAIPDHVWEPQTTRLLVYLASLSNAAIVGGAYFGDHVILMAKQLAKNGGICHAFEPNRAQAGMLKRNILLNMLDNVRVNGLALWDESDLSLQLEGDDALAHSTLATGTSADAFQTTTIDAYVEAQQIAQLDLIMIDIEGGELRALLGAQSQLRRAAEEAPVVVFEMHAAYVDWSNGLEQTPVIQLLMQHGYSVFALRDCNANRPMAGYPIELIPAADVYLEGPPHGFNMIACKRAGVLDTALFRFCSHVSPKLLAHKDPALHHPLHTLNGQLAHQ